MNRKENEQEIIQEIIHVNKDISILMIWHRMSNKKSIDWWIKINRHEWNGY